MTDKPNQQQRGRFFLGIGAVLLPILAALLFNLSSAGFQTFHWTIKAIVILVTPLTLSGIVFCWVAGLIPWSTKNEAD